MTILSEWAANVPSYPASISANKSSFVPRLIPPILDNIHRLTTKEHDLLKQIKQLLKKHFYVLQTRKKSDIVTFERITLLKLTKNYKSQYIRFQSAFCRFCVFLVSFTICSKVLLRFVEKVSFSKKCGKKENTVLRGRAS